MWLWWAVSEGCFPERNKILEWAVVFATNLFILKCILIQKGRKAFSMMFGSKIIVKAQTWILINKESAFDVNLVEGSAFLEALKYRNSVATFFWSCVDTVKNQQLFMHINNLQLATASWWLFLLLCKIKCIHKKPIWNTYCIYLSIISIFYWLRNKS